MSVSIEKYIKNFNCKHSKFRITKWIHDHPTIVKIIQLSGLILGTIILYLSFFNPEFILSASITVGTLGSLSILSSFTIWFFLKYITCAKYDMKIHAYQEKQCEGGRLYYRDDIPILEFTGNTPEKWGYAHGFLLADKIYKLKKNLDLAMHNILLQPRSKNLPQVLKAIKKQIPLEYLDEMTSLAKGYNKWAKETGFSHFITIDDLLLMHSMPDIKHFYPKKLEKKMKKDTLIENLTSFSCTSILDRDDQGNVIFGRNMDWCPFGEGGAKSLVMVWKNKGIAVLGVPGLIGTITGWNKYNVAIAMNVCPGKTTEIRGMPSILFNRLILESSENVKEIYKLVESKKPLGPYHLTIANAKEGCCISFYQKIDGNNYLRKLDDKKYIDVLNWVYPKCEGGYFNSYKRYKLLNKYFNNAKNIPNRHPKLMENILQLSPYINSWITMHSLVFRPSENTVKMRWDNGYAAGRWIKAKMTDFFS